ncbi:MAG: fumarate hydratase C-terminal domain-containing protein [Saccharofermentanales bacterium]|jgi:fumarate hydratase subunit beta|nr:fumarate hydratase C-terminal domain-containing protein [Bacillota bacterium]NLB09436.1 fumarate hydratase [Clostridiales bacterium]
MKECIYLTNPITDNDILSLKVGDIISFSGFIYCGRDAVLPKIVKLYQEKRLEDNGIDLSGSLIFHTAVSTAGIGATSSNKYEIESSIAPLSEAGTKIHLGKGMISQTTIEALQKCKSIFAIIPPVTALLQSKIEESEIVAFPEEGMEAFFRLRIREIKMIVAVAHGESIYKE